MNSPESQKPRNMPYLTAFFQKKIFATSSKTSEDNDLSQLTNEQLAKKLRNFGVTVGPIGRKC